MNHFWKKISGSRVYSNPFFSVTEDKVVKPDGSEGMYYTVHNRPGVAVVAYSDNAVLLVNQYRYPIQKRIWSFVAGGAEHEDVLADAQRELKEETGYTAGKWTRLGSFPSSPSTTDQHSVVYVAEELVEGQHEREPGEMDMEHRFFTFAEIDQLIAYGEFSAFDIADYCLLKKYLENKL